MKSACRRPEVEATRGRKPISPGRIGPVQEKVGPQGSKTVRERLLVCVKTPRSDTDEVDEYEAIVTSELHAQADRAKKLTREEKAASSGGSDKDPQPEDGAEARGRPTRGR